MESMDFGPGHSASYYAASAGLQPARPTLRGAQTADLCIVGGGYTGLNAALRAAELGHSVILLEAKRIGWGASGRNGGQVIWGQRQDQIALEVSEGREAARALWDLSREALARVRALIETHAIDAELRHGHLSAAWKPAHADELKAYAVHMTRNYGYEAARYVAKADMPDHVASARYHGGLFDAESMHLHPLKFAYGIAKAAETAGARLFEDSAAIELIKGGAPIVRTAEGQVRSKFVVLACNGYLGGLERTIAPYILPIDNYIVATEPFDEQRARDLIPCGAAVSDTKFVLDYYRISADGRLIFGGGETYGGGGPADVREFVRPYVERVFPQLAGVKLDYGWGGTLAITMPRMPHVGRIDGNVYFAHGYSGHGVATASQMGALIADAIHGQAAKFDVYGSLKIPKLPGGAWLRRPLLTAALLWYSLRDRL
jgi:gamma-glutamylputrescine oxidase